MPDTPSGAPAPGDGALVLRSHGLLIRAVRAESREADFVASTDTIDSYDEVVDQSWRLERFRANPVILFAHNSRDLPIGQATRVEVVNGQLECTVRFASEKANPMAEKVWQSVCEKTLRAVSVGFNPNDVRYEKRNGREVLVLADNELFEISVTPIPANPDALAKMRARAAAQRGPKEAMNPDQEKLSRELNDKTAALVEVTQKFEASQAELATLRSSLVEIARARDEALASAAKASKERDEARARALDLELDVLVGKKILPSERASFRKLAASDRELFDEMMASRKDLGLLEQVVRSDNTADAPPPEGDGSVDITSEAMSLGSAGA